MRKLGGKAVELGETKNPDVLRWDTEQGGGEIHQNTLPRSARRSSSTVVMPDLSHIPGTRQHREAQEAKRKGKANG